MSSAWKRIRHRAAWLLVLAALTWCAPAPAQDLLRWNTRENKADADVASAELLPFLERLVSATGWQVYVEPDTRHTVSAKFKGRTGGDALRLLLGDLSFALLPQTNGPAKLFVFRTSLGDATLLVRAPAKSAEAKPIPNELIVTLKPGAKIEDLARQLGAKVLGRIGKLNAYRLGFDDEESTSKARDLLKDNPEVASVESNYPVFPEPAPEALAMSSVPPLDLKIKAVGDANRLIIGLVDTALHPQGASADPFLLPSLSVAGESKLAAGDPTHGDSMAQALLRGVSSMFEGKDGTRIRILPVDVYGGNPTTSTFDVANGIVEAVNSGAMVINLSLGSEGSSELMHRVITDASQQGVIFFAAAGNQPSGTPTFPAAFAEVNAVTAGSTSGQIAPWANYGDFVDIVAPGSVVVSYQGKSYLVSGTSASTAFASGAAAGLADDTGKKLNDVVSALRAAFAPKSKPR
jgi:hypothetical protein